MDERWREMWGIFYEAAALPAAERAAYLRDACGDDAALRSEIESLLRHDGHPEALRTQSSQRMNLIGQRIGVYEIRSLLGAGGMGEVYGARDTKLDRDVAIKVLPSEVASDAERLSRFQREAKILASLNHPHIGAIYGFEDGGGVPALVLEFVDGETLAGRIANGPIPVPAALEIARQIADALEAAHEHGIIHRDLKPANIKIAPDGTVKVLDFGLAKAVSLGRDFSRADIVDTHEGTILGTAAYMSPEQARGKAVDKRADIWAFGCVLYEMLAGKRAFDGDDVTDTLARILEREPDWLALPDSIPPTCRRVLTRCLQKDPNRRLRDVGDARLDIEEALLRPTDSAASPVSGANDVQRSLLRWRIVALITAAIAATVAGIAVLDIRPSSTVARAVRFVVELPDGWTSGPTRDPSAVREPGHQSPTVNLAVSPDGTRLAFVAVGADRQQLLWVRDIGVLTPRALPGTDGASSPFWSPNGQFIGFFADGKLKTVDVSGGAVSTLCDARNNRGASWGSDGVIVFATAGAPLQRVSASGGKPVAASRFEKGEESHVYPVFLSDGRHFLYRAITADSHRHPVYAATLDSDDRTVVLESSSDTPISGNVGYSREHLLFTSETTLMGQPFDERRLTINGDAFPVAEDVRGVGNIFFGIGYFSASPNGVLAFETGGTEQSELVWYDRQGRELTKLGEPGLYSSIRLSPSGDLATVNVHEPGKLPDIWIYDVHLGRRTPFYVGPVVRYRRDLVADRRPDCFRFKPQGSRGFIHEGDKRSGSSGRGVA